MSPRERLLRVLRGQTADRVPIYTQIPFGLSPNGFRPAPFHGYEDYDDWRQRDPRYWDLVRRMEEECDNFFIWQPPCMKFDPFFIPLSLTKLVPLEPRGEKIVTARILTAGAKQLRAVSAVQPGTGHTWALEHWCKSPQDAEFLLTLPWDGHPAKPGDFFQLQQCLGEKGLMWVTIPSPLAVVCQLFDPTEFLIFVRTERSLIHRLMETAAARIHQNLAALLDAGVGPVIRFGGAEQATPPLMSPADFDDLIVRYDTPLMQLVKQHKCMVAVHCHGRLRHALARFVEMGVDQTDPVEQLPDGDLSAAEARQIAAGAVTLTGNIQIRELSAADPQTIRSRVRQFVDDVGPDRLIITTTGTPLERISPQLADNYHAMIDAALGRQCHLEK